MLSHGDVLDVRVGAQLPSYPPDVACAVLGAIDAAGIEGADRESLVRAVHFADALLHDVLRDLHDAGLAGQSADGRYRMTPFGEQVLIVAGCSTRMTVSIAAL